MVRYLIRGPVNEKRLKHASIVAPTIRLKPWFADKIKSGIEVETSHEPILFFILLHVNPALNAPAKRITNRSSFLRGFGTLEEFIKLAEAGHVPMCVADQHCVRSKAFAIEGKMTRG